MREPTLAGRQRVRFGVIGAALCLLVVANVLTFDWIERRYVIPASYRAIAPGEISDMNPAEQPSRRLRESTTRLYGLYLTIGEVDGRTVASADDVVPDPQLLFGLGRVDDLNMIARDGAAAVAIADTSCEYLSAGVDDALGSYDLCLSKSDRIVMFRAGDVVMVRDARD